ncbi:lytic murein transglycosylase [Afipia massiliensis]|uniref:Lytic murein transglycosylase n=1 Tax=Afipia massiliensis TaxID=211460 RepID=A0A840N2W6_9BRAD|nr:lytic murein transglycosylase [Afipia massiliensis]MBB5054433.1 lytic murein transglycosylase [Afipia massiliensis]
MTRIDREQSAWLMVAGAALTVSVVAVVSLMAGPAHGQTASGRGGLVQPRGDITGSIQQQPQAPRQMRPAPRRMAQAAPPKEWSGEDGASGHPLMTADAIRRSAANFDRCVAGFWPEAHRRGVSQASFQRFTADLSPDLRIMDLMDSQPEFTKAVWDYLDILVTDARLARGREVLAQHAATFAAVEKAYGVDRYIIAAIWGIESNYSTQGGDRSVLNSTATLACIGRRQGYFKDEFLAALEILHHGDLTPQQLRGSWAGAFGATQFMPTAFKRFAVDFDRDGKRNVVDDVPDIIASTAAKFKKDNWQQGQTWGYEVEVPQGFNYLHADRAKSYTIGQWEQLGVRRAGGKPFPRNSDKAFLLAPAGADGPGFLMLGNFRSIMRYNPSEAYALAIGHFADRLRGGGPFLQEWPRQERVLSRTERLELQQLLAQRGFYRGEPDGNLGGETRNALRSFQASIGAPADGFASSGVLDRLRRR